jgi:hypothetical protein
MNHAAYIPARRGNNFSLSPGERAGVRVGFLHHHFQIHGKGLEARAKHE